jgi:integrase
VGVRRQAQPQKTPGECYDRYSLANLFSRPIKRWNKRNPEKPIKVFGPSVLRRLQAQEIRNALGLEASRAALGHSNSLITQEHYARSDYVLAAQVAKALG